ncbi:diaminopimelate decarboxylase [Corynebacterium frankenforstense]
MPESVRQTVAAFKAQGRTAEEAFNELPANVWPTNARRQEDGVVTIAGVPLPEIVEEYGAPVVVVDEADFRLRARQLARAFGGPDHVHYAAKAFLTRQIARWVDEEGLSLDVASAGELAIALASGFPAARITVHGNNKTRGFLEQCVRAGVGHVVLDSPGELHMLDDVARGAGAVQSVLVRVTPGVEAHTHEFIATSHEDQKFGFSLASGAAFEAVRDALAAEGLHLDGLHCHVGSQVFDAEGFSLAAQRVLGLLGRVVDELGPEYGGREALAEELSLLDLGGGFGIAYTVEEDPLDVAGVARDMLSQVAAHAEASGVPAPTVMVEPGRAIVGPSAVTVYEVGTVKDVAIDEGITRRYLAVSGGMSDNIRPMLYDANYDARLVNRFTEGEAVAGRVVGSHCESGDILVHDLMVPDDVGVGDLVALAATGAYCLAMSSNYNAACRPPVVVVDGGEARLMVRRETVEDLMAREVL